MTTHNNANAHKKDEYVIRLAIVFFFLNIIFGGTKSVGGKNTDCEHTDQNAHDYTNTSSLRAHAFDSAWEVPVLPNSQHLSTLRRTWKTVFASFCCVREWSFIRSLEM